MKNLDEIFLQFKEYIKMRKDIKSEMHIYEINEIKKIKGFYLINKEWLTSWKNLINYSFLKLINDDEKIKGFIKENISKRNIELNNIEYHIDCEEIIKNNGKYYKIVTKNFLNCFLKDNQKLKEEKDSISCYFGNDKIIIEFEEKNKLICKAKMQGDLLYILFQNYKEEEKEDIIKNILKIVSYKFLKVLAEIPILKGKYTILRWDQMIRQDDFFYDDLFNDYDPMEYYEDIKFIDQNSIPEKILEIFFLYYAMNLKIIRDINKKANISEEEDQELYFVNIRWMEELKNIYNYEDVIKIIPNNDITFEFLSKNYDIYVHGARYQKIYSKKSANIKQFKETFEFRPSVKRLKKVENNFLFINYINNFAIINWKAYCFIRQFFDYNHKQYDFRANCALTNGKLIIAINPIYILITSQTNKNENHFKTEFIIYYNIPNYVIKTINKTIIEDFIQNLEKIKDKTLIYFNRNETNNNYKNIFFKIKEQNEVIKDEEIIKILNGKKSKININIESISSIKEFPFMELAIVNPIDNIFFAPLNIILHSFLQIDLLVNYFFTPEIKKLYESEESEEKELLEDFLLTKSFQIILYHYWKPIDESLIINTSNIINSFTLLSLLKKLIEKKHINKMPQKIVISFINLLHKELNNFNRKEIEKNNKNEIINPYDRTIVLNNFISNFKNNYHSIISDHFFGVNEKIYECMKCKELEKNGIIHCQKIFKYEVFNHLEFNIEDISLYKIQRNQNNSIKEININDCIESLSLPICKISNLDDELIYCKSCNIKICPIIYTNIFSLPRILIITLDYGNIKDNKFSLKYKEKEIIKNNNYILLSVFGQLKDKYCLANRNPIDNKWYLYEKIKYLEDIGKEIINNTLFKPLYLIYKISNENVNNNNNLIFSINEEIDIYFICMESQMKYKLNVPLNLQFIKVIHKLLNTYPELENKNIFAYLYNANKINLFNTVLENNLVNNSLVLMVNKI